MKFTVMYLLFLDTKRPFKDTQQSSFSLNLLLLRSSSHPILSHKADGSCFINNVATVFDRRRDARADHNEVNPLKGTRHIAELRPSSPC